MSRKMMTPKIMALAAAVGLAALACGGAGSQDAATESAPPSGDAGNLNGQAAMPSGHPGGLVPSHSGTTAGEAAGEVPSGVPRWSVPEGWKSETPSSRMRQAQYRIPAAAGDSEDGECAVFYFGPGQGGDVQSNIARWAGQFTDADGRPAQPVVSQVEAQGVTITRVEAGGAYRGSPMSMTGGPAGTQKEDHRLLGAIIPGAEANWFIKCTGPQKTMAANGDAFDEMLASVRYHD